MWNFYGMLVIIINYVSRGLTSNVPKISRNLRNFCSKKQSDCWNM